MKRPTEDRMHVEVEDITTLKRDAIVNAANESLLGGGGVDGAIHRRAGPDLLKECRALGGCPVGQARITRGFRLPALNVIHTVGPVYQDGAHNEAALLASCYTESLKLCERQKLRTVAFPAISTGIFGYPKDEAAEIAVRAVRDWLDAHELPEEVTFCCFSEEDGARYRAVLSAGRTHP